MLGFLKLRQAARGVFAFCLMVVMSTAILDRSAKAEAVTYALDPTHLTVSFLIDHIGYAKTLGIFRDVSGTFVYDEEAGTVSDINVVIATASVDTFLEARDAHVRNKDFLNVEEFPEMTFVGTDAVAETDTNGTVTGDLTLLGVTQPVELSATLNKSAPYPFGANPPNVLGISIRGHFNRSDFGMAYGVENGLVGDRVDLIIEVEAAAQ